MRITKYILKIIIHNLLILKPIFYLYTIYLKFSPKNNFRSKDYIESSINTIESHICPTINNLITNDSNIKILDVGCGPDIFINIYLFLKYKYKINQTMTDRIKELNKNSYQKNFEFFFKRNIDERISNFFSKNFFISQKLTNEKISDYYDLIYSIYVIEHFNDKELKFFLSNIKSRSKYYIFVIDFADTYFIDKWIDEHDKYKFQYLKYPDFLWKIINNKFIYQSRMRVNEYRNLFKKNGFEIINFKRCNTLCEEKNDEYFIKKYFNKNQYNRKFQGHK